MLITLTTDFGTADGYVGAMKGVIARRAPGAAIVDISHDIARHDIAAAAYALAVAAPEFPPQTIHVAVVDPGVGGARRAVIACAGGQRFVGPDNGVFQLVAPEPEAIYEIADPRFVREPISSTFHGRDLFAPAAAALASGLAPSVAGPATELSGALLVGERVVVHVDHFGNLISDIPGHELAVDRRVVVAGRRIPVVDTFSDGHVGQLLAYVGSAGTVEIAVREGSAAEHLGAGRGTPVEIRGRDDD